MNIKVTEEFAKFKVDDVLENIDHCAGKSLIRQGKAIEATLEDIALKHGQKKVTAKTEKAPRKSAKTRKKDA